MFIFSGSSDGILVLFQSACAWFVGVTIGAAVLSILLRPLDTPDSSKKSRLAEAFLFFTVGGFLFTIFFRGSLVGEFVSMILVLFYAIAMVISPIIVLLIVATSLLPKPIPLKYSLAEMIAMVVAIAFSPVMISTFYSVSLETDAAVILLVAFIVGAFLYKKALYRLNSNHVPHGATRTAFLLVYPYMVYACLYFFARGSILILVLCSSSSRIRFSVDQTSIIQFVEAACIVGLGAFLARKAKSEARPVADETVV